MPSGRDPGGVAIALFGTGIDYTLPLAQRLARDGEGELIGWDLEDKDRKPVRQEQRRHAPEWGGDGTPVASLLVARRPLRLVPVRVDRQRSRVGGARHCLRGADAGPRRGGADVGHDAGGLGAISPGRRALQGRAARRARGDGSRAGLSRGAEPRQRPGRRRRGPRAPTRRGSVAAISASRARLLAVAAAGMAAADLLAREPGLDAAALKRRLGEAGGGLMWQAQR